MSYHNEKCTVLLPVRTQSKRLSKKALMRINGESLIKILISRIKKCKNIENIIICTTTDSSDNELVELLNTENITIFRGDSTDIVERLYQAAKTYDLKYFVEVDGDDLFCEPSLIDETCKYLRSNNFEFIKWDGLPFGTSPLGIKTEKLEFFVKNKINKNTETGWGQLLIDSKMFKTLRVTSPNKILNRPEIRLTIDYKEDYELAKRILENLPLNFDLIDVIQLLENNPKWLKINYEALKKYKINFENNRARIKMKKDW